MGALGIRHERDAGSFCAFSPRELKGKVEEENDLGRVYHL